MARLNRERFPDPNVPPPGTVAVTYGDGLLVSEGSVVEVDFGTDHDQVARGDAAAGGASPLTTNGDLWFYSTTDTRLPVGTTAQVLRVVAGLPAWSSLPWAADTSTGVSTADATQTTCGSYTVPNNTAVFLELTVHANKTDRTAGAGWKVRAHAINDAGTVTISGGDIGVDGPTGSAVTWSVTLDVSGTAVRLRVTGEAATDITWTARWIVS